MKNESKVRSCKKQYKNFSHDFSKRSRMPNNSSIITQIKIYTLYSQLSVNGRLSKTDTSIRRTPGDGPCRFSVILHYLNSL